MIFFFAYLLLLLGYPILLVVNKYSNKGEVRIYEQISKFCLFTSIVQYLGLLLGFLGVNYAEIISFSWSLLSCFSFAKVGGNKHGLLFVFVVVGFLAFFYLLGTFNFLQLISIALLNISVINIFRFFIIKLNSRRIDFTQMVNLLIIISILTIRIFYIGLISQHSAWLDNINMKLLSNIQFMLYILLYLFVYERRIRLLIR